MATKTSNFEFTKPEPNDFYDINVINENWDKVDSLMKDVHGFIGYTDQDIYGVEVDFANNKFTRLAGAVGKTPGADFDSVNAFGGRRRCMMGNSEIRPTTYYGEAGYQENGFNASDVHHQIMVEQPKFYYRVVPIETETISKYANGEWISCKVIKKARYYVSDTKKDGFKVHPAFVVNEHEMPQIYLAAYDGSLYNRSGASYSNGGGFTYSEGKYALSSIIGKEPAAEFTIDQFREMALGRNYASTINYWSMQTIQSVSATQLLFLIEYASFNAQQKLIVENGVAMPTANTQVIENGLTSSLGNQSGAVRNADGYVSTSYRGEENFFGNVGSWIDNVEIIRNGNRIVVDGKSIDMIFPDADGYISRFAYFDEADWMFFPAMTEGNSSLPVGDQWSQKSAYTAPDFIVHGGHFSLDDRAGMFHYDTRYNNTFDSVVIGARLLYRPIPVDPADDDE